jgi:hypothetical protein
MADTNATGFAWNTESAFKVANTTGWRKAEVNNPTDFGAQIGKTARDPISTDRNRRAGKSTSLRSSVTVEMDATLSHLRDFVPRFLFVTPTGVGTQAVSEYAVTAVVDGGGSEDEFTVGADGDLVAGELIYARGMGVEANNGLWLVVATSSATAIKVATGSLTAEGAAPDNATVEIAGVQGGSGDLEIDSNGDLISTTLDFEDYNLTVGQYIKIGGTAAGTFFATSGNPYARIDAIDANKLTLSRVAGDALATDNGSGKTIQIFYGRFCRNVDVNDADFNAETITWEAAYDYSTPEYDYPVGNKCNLLSLGFPLENIATMTVGFVGGDTPAPTTSRKSGASSALEPNATDSFSTASEIAFINLLDENDADLGVQFESLTLSMNNNLTPKSVLGTFGAVTIPAGNIHIDLDGSMLFETTAMSTAARNDTDIGMQVGLANIDGAMILDVPSSRVGDAKLSFPRNETITQAIPLMVHKDPTLGYAASVSFFPHIPA